MSTFRKSALDRAYSHSPLCVTTDSSKPSELFGTNVFGNEAMRQFLPSDAFKAVINVIEHGGKMNFNTANEVATGMKAWALNKGATHYTHWFQPLSRATGEKHDAFLNLAGNMKAIDKFEGDQLIQQEPDASSFPSGGMRNTFEARGYTVWDPSSPAFIIGKTLCIPTIFISFTGEALDYKTPLLKALALVDKAAVDVCQYFDKNITKVHATLGWEQEYFLVDKALYDARPDLVLSDRTLFGHASAKGQQLEDHYFGSIPDRVMAFMTDFEVEAWKLGIPAKTRHNEVAPNQFELAPIFEEVNLSNDHNLLVMYLMTRIANKHNFQVIFHEKPFAGINGSGKHNNWNLIANGNINLYKPGKTPGTNLMFLSFFVNTIKAVHDYADLIRAAIATPNNDHRLGANEAPPAIISVFLGTNLFNLLNDIETGKITNTKAKTKNNPNLNPNLNPNPNPNLNPNPNPNPSPNLDINYDETDRNRTSPFAFTGNKFEFRATGSSANCSTVMFVLNTIVANQLIEFKKDVDKLLKTSDLRNQTSDIRLQTSILKVIKSYISSSKKIMFEGDNYCEDWVKEAAKRGLPNITNAPEALKALVSDKNIELITKYNLLTKREIHARHHIELENYFKTVQIESRLISEIALNQVIPAAITYQNSLIQNVNGIQSINSNIKSSKSSNLAILQSDAQIELISEISAHVSAIKTKVYQMTEERKKANKEHDVYKHAYRYCFKVKPYFDEIRYHADKLELLIPDEQWSLPKYRELLFIR